MKWLIIGTGGISQKFIKGLISNGETPYAIFSRKKETGEIFAKNNNIPKVFTNLQEALNNVDAVYIGTPNTIHYEQAITSLENKKHTIVEKPMTDSYEKTEYLFNLASINKVKLMESFAHINHPEYMNLKFKNNDIVEANFERVSSKYKKNEISKSWIFSKKMFGGVMPDLGVYSLSLLIYHFGSVKNIKLSNKEYHNDVLAKVTLDIEFEKNKGIARLSKIHTGSEDLIINNNKLSMDSHAGWIKNRFHFEVKNFLENNNIDKLKFVSLEVAKVLDSIKDELFISI